jgi:phage/plasmid-associated DNA primase
MGEQVFFFCDGQGAICKSVFLAILRALLGEYARHADYSTLQESMSAK